MFSSVAWVKRGVARSDPFKFNLDDDALQELIASQKIEAQELQLMAAELGQSAPMEEDSEEENTAATVPEEADTNMEMDKVEDELAIYNLDKYDEEKQEQDESNGIFSHIKGLSYYKSNDEDPFITLKDEQVDEEEEREEMKILETDSVLLAARTEDDLSHIEVHIFEADGDNLYVHHDFMIPSFPLCLEWVGYPIPSRYSDPSRSHGHFVAVGTMEPEIEIWNLDVLDATLPEMVLGAAETGKKKQKKANKERHVDAVMGLSWNQNTSHLLASSSADGTVKLWDLAQKGVCLRSFDHHTNKVQSVQWHPTEAAVLLTGSYDHTLTAFDTRAPQAKSVMKVNSDIECAKWDPHAAHHCVVSLEDGGVHYFDVRQPQAPLLTIAAHSKACTSLDFSPLVPGLLLTASVDHFVKVWDLSQDKASCIASRDLRAGKLFTAAFCRDTPYALACAGQGPLKLWNLSQNGAIKRVIDAKLTAAQLPIPAALKSEVEELTVTGCQEESETEA